MSAAPHEPSVRIASGPSSPAASVSGEPREGTSGAPAAAAGARTSSSPSTQLASDGEPHGDAGSAREDSPPTSAAREPSAPDSVASPATDRRFSPTASGALLAEAGATEADASSASEQAGQSSQQGATAAPSAGEASAVNVEASTTPLAAAGAQAGAEESASAPSSAPSGVDMQGMIDAIRGTIQLAARQGSAHARISLAPEELGQIRIHLTQTRDGLLARLSADTPDAARALQAGRSELAQSLRSTGTQLLSLDIDSFAQPQTHGGAWSGASAQADEARSPSQQASEEPDARNEEPARAATSRGVLVDLLA